MLRLHNVRLLNAAMQQLQIANLDPAQTVARGYDGIGLHSAKWGLCGEMRDRGVYHRL
ncbi:MAG: hypothetical protein ACPGFC_08515 [Paracoccaceae bacterium]